MKTKLFLSLTAMLLVVSSLICDDFEVLHAPYCFKFSTSEINLFKENLPRTHMYITGTNTGNLSTISESAQQEQYNEMRNVVKTHAYMQDERTTLSRDTNLPPNERCIAQIA